jgi:hypothetical protein
LRPSGVGLATASLIEGVLGALSLRCLRRFQCAIASLLEREGRRYRAFEPFLIFDERKTRSRNGPVAHSPPEKWRGVPPAPPAPVTVRPCGSPTLNALNARHEHINRARYLIALARYISGPAQTRPAHSCNQTRCEYVSAPVMHDLGIELPDSGVVQAEAGSRRQKGLAAKGHFRPQPSRRRCTPQHRSASAGPG